MKLRAYWNRFQEKFPKLFFPPESEPLIFLGNQRSGSSAISNLFAYATGLSICSDIGGLHQTDIEEIMNGSQAFETFKKKNPRCFSKKIIKEPSLTFLFEAIDAHYSSLASYFFIVRDPFENIRSILDKVGLPGDKEELDEEDLKRVRKVEWRKILYNDWLGVRYENYVASLAQRWKMAVDIYLQHQDRMVLLHYEDFIKDKVSFIDALAVRSGYDNLRSIEKVMDHPFQTRGVHKQEPAEAFFGERNCRIIQQICGPQMEAFGYNKGRVDERE